MSDGSASAPPSSDPLGPTLRRQVEQLVRPLYVGLDGAAGFDRVSKNLIKRGATGKHVGQTAGKSVAASAAAALSQLPP